MGLGWRAGPLAEREFRVLWVGQTTSAFGSAVVPVALTFALVELTHSASALGLVLTAGFVARIVLVLPGGGVADRWPRQRVMPAADSTRCVTQAVVAALLLSGAARVWELAVLCALYGARAGCLSPAA